jgi:DNA repair protein RecO (recombination protein O)
MIVKTEAIVLRSRKYGETSKILHFYTKEFGKLSVIAKGARGPKSKFGAALQPLSHVVAVLYKHEHRELHLLSQCDGLTRFRALTEDLEKFSAAMSVVELIEHVVHDEERNEQLFGLVLATLKAIDETLENALNIQCYFELSLSDVLGFRPNVHTCLTCGRSLDEDHVGTKGGELRLGNGGVLCTRCSGSMGDRGTISLGALSILRKLQETNGPEAVTPMKFARHHMDEVRMVLRQYLQSHVGGLHRLKVQGVAASIT